MGTPGGCFPEIKADANSFRDFSGCDKLSLRGMLLTAEYLRRLFRGEGPAGSPTFQGLGVLDLSGCTKIAWDDLDFNDPLVVKFLENLTELDLSNTRIPQRVLTALLFQCTNLQHLYLRDWQKQILYADSQGNIQLTLRGLFTKEQPLTRYINDPSPIKVHYASCKPFILILLINSLGNFVVNLVSSLSYVKFLWPPLWFSRS